MSTLSLEFPFVSHFFALSYVLGFHFQYVGWIAYSNRVIFSGKYEVVVLAVYNNLYKRKKIENKEVILDNQAGWWVSEISISALMIQIDMQSTIKPK